MKILSFAAAALLLIATPCVSALAADSSIQLSHGWTRATPPNAPSGGGYIEITNKGNAPDRLIGVKTPAAKRAEVHEMSMKDGVMVMREVKGGIEIPAGATVTLKPGSYHLMFMKLTSPFKQGSMLPVTLTFAHAGDISTKLMVEKMGAKSMEGHDTMGHGDMKGDGMGEMKMKDGEMDHSKHGMKAD